MGNVVFESSKNRYFVNLTVSAFKHTTSEDEWRNSFGFVSKLLFDATKQQMQLGEVTFKNNSSTSAETDVDLFVSCGKSNVRNGANKIPFYGTVQLRMPAKTEPLVTVHELAHYVLCIRDEYAPASNGIPRCQSDASTGECIMEFARNHGIKLTPDCSTVQSTPAENVTNFCFTNHVEDNQNPQHLINATSCWNTLADPVRYGEMKLPNAENLPNHELEPIIWTPTDGVDKYAFAIVGTNSFATERTSLAIKASLKAWMQFIAITGDHAAIVFSSGEQQFRDMAPVDHEELDQLFSRIDQIDFGATENFDAQNVVNLINNQFTGIPGGHQRVVLLGPGQFAPDFGFVGLEPLLQRKRLRFVGTSFGQGVFDDQLRTASQQSKWIDHSGFLIQSGDFESYAFDLQSHLVQQYFVSKPGHTTAVELYCRFKQSRPAAAKTLPERRIRLGRAGGVELIVNDLIELPVFVEKGATAAFFVLGEPDAGQIDFKLVAPYGDTIDKEAQGIQKSVGEHNVSWFRISQNVNGRWVVKLRRIKDDIEIPFHFFVAVENPSFRMSTKVTLLEKGKVVFQCQTIYGSTLDFVESIVEVYSATPKTKYAGDVIQSLVLQRHYENDPPNDNRVQISGYHYQGELDLPQGNYIAVFRTSNSGQAIYAANHSCAVESQFDETDFEPIPAFSRCAIERFSI